MKSYIVLLLNALFVISFFPCFGQNPKVLFALHGGAGTILKKNMTPEKEKQYREKLEEAALEGFEVLQSGGSSITAVQAAINILEDSPLFNAGRGSVYNYEGEIENDASIMDGHSLEAGAVCGVQNIKNPINAALAVLMHSNHVMLSGSGATDFAKKHEVEFARPEWFQTEKRYNSLQKVKERLKEEQNGEKGKGSDQKDKDNSSGYNPDYLDFNDYKYGTVGAVALDLNGNLAAGTSTGGMTNKRFGRIGDSPVIGAGTYANNKTCAVSSTGHGEYFIRLAVAFQIAAAMEYGKMGLQEAVNVVILTKLTQLGGKGGVIALDKKGNVAMRFNTPGMYRAFVAENGEVTVKLYGEDEE